MEITALLIGFVGSLHCLAMCSPLSIAVTNTSSRAFSNRVLYNGGRILTYSLVGALFSSIGILFYLAPIQNIVSIILGLLLLSMGLTNVSYFRIPFLTPAIQTLTTFIKMKFGMLFSKKNYFITFLLGMLNGLLPCGLSFVAFAYCITLKGPVDGFIFMWLFGLGTLPAMLGGASVILSLIQTLRLNTSRVNSNLLILSGVVLLLRVYWVVAFEAYQTGESPIDIVLCR